MENKNDLTVHESLELITSSIYRTKENISEQAVYFKLWGWLVILAALAHYVLMIQAHYAYIFIPWIMLPIVGFTLSFYAAKNQKEERTVETFFDTFLKYLWLTLSVAFVLTIVYSAYFDINPVSFILLLASIGTIVSGLTIRFRPLWIGGIAILVLSVLSLFVSNESSLLISILAMIFGYLIPSYMITKNK